MDVDIYFSEFFGVDPEVLEEYGAFDISVVSDLPLFVDPFLLFNSEDAEYQNLHEEILEYLRFLRDRTTPDLDAGLIDAWYRFKEVKQNWLGYTLFGNEGAGLGRDFAVALHGALGDILGRLRRGDRHARLASGEALPDHSRESARTTSATSRRTSSRPGCATTPRRSCASICSEDDCQRSRSPRARFNYDTRTWATERYYLPSVRGDFVLLTPVDMLTRDDTWINYTDMVSKFGQLPEAVSNAEQRAQHQPVLQARGSVPIPTLSRSARPPRRRSASSRS